MQDTVSISLVLPFSKKGYPRMGERSRGLCSGGMIKTCCFKCSVKIVIAGEPDNTPIIYMKDRCYYLFTSNLPCFEGAPDSLLLNHHCIPINKGTQCLKPQSSTGQPISKHLMAEARATRSHHFNIWIRKLKEAINILSISRLLPCLDERHWISMSHINTFLLCFLLLLFSHNALPSSISSKLLISMPHAFPSGWTGIDVISCTNCAGFWEVLSEYL